MRACVGNMKCSPQEPGPRDFVTSLIEPGRVPPLALHACPVQVRGWVYLTMAAGSNGNGYGSCLTRAGLVTCVFRGVDWMVVGWQTARGDC